MQSREGGDAKSNSNSFNKEQNLEYGWRRLPPGGRRVDPARVRELLELDALRSRADVEGRVCFRIAQRLRVGPLVISEINYDPADNTVRTEFIELLSTVSHCCVTRNRVVQSRAQATNGIAWKRDCIFPSGPWRLPSIGSCR